MTHGIYRCGDTWWETAAHIPAKEASGSPALGELVGGAAGGRIAVTARGRWHPIQLHQLVQEVHLRTITFR